MINSVADPLAAYSKAPLVRKPSRENALEKELMNEEKSMMGARRIFFEDKKDYSMDKSPMLVSKVKTNQTVPHVFPVRATEEPPKNPFLLVAEGRYGNSNNAASNLMGSSVKLTRQSSDSKQRPASAERRSTKNLRSLGFSNSEIVPGELLAVDLKCTVSLMQYPTISARALFVLTNYRIMIKPDDPTFFEKYPLKPDYLKIPVGFISKFEKSPDKKDSTTTYLDIASKDGRMIKVRLSDSQVNEYNLIKYLSIYAFPDQKEQFFAFTHYDYARDLEDRYQGWKIYDIESEFRRQGLDFLPFGQPQTDSPQKYLYRIISNKDFQTCSTYPPLLLVPAKISDQAIISSSKFRSKERLPVITYYYAKRGTLLSRSSQSKPGLYQSRCAADEILLRYLGNPFYDEVKDPEPTNVNLYIFDARPYLNAMANRVNGKGFEDTKWYKNCEIDFMDIDNIHRVRDSYKKLLTLCYSADATNPKWLSQLESTNWLELISFIMGASCKVAQYLQEGKNCLVHCSDGWDRTAQILSLAQIMLDPYFRTIAGFEVLIMKEWVNFGHQFNMRMGHGNKNEKDDQRSPVFIQFLDCVHQLLHQYPFAFEFNDTFLAHIGYHAYSCQFGTFLCNTYGEVVKANIDTKTISVWSLLNSQKEKYINPFYNTVHGHESLALRPSNHAKYLRLWEEVFLYYSWLSKPNYTLSNKLVFAKDFYADIYQKEKERADRLEAENAELRTRLNLSDAENLKLLTKARSSLNPPKNEEITRSKSIDKGLNFRAEELTILKKEESKEKELDVVNLEGDKLQSIIKDKEEEEAVLWKEKNGQAELGYQTIKQTEKGNLISETK